MNTQEPLKQSLVTDGSLLVHSIFKTIQGEGPFVGQPCVFVRLAGCNLQCPLCDTEYTVGTGRMTTLSIVTAIFNIFPETRLVVITGGEPFRQEISPLVKALVSSGHVQVQIETNGTLYTHGFDYIGLSNLVTVVCSPKTGRVNKLLLHYIKAWKYVATADSLSPVDGLPVHALEHPASPQLARPPEGALVYLQPVDEGDPELNKKNLDSVIASCYKFGYRLGLQIHKLIGEP